MSVTGKAFITQALQEIGVLAGGEVATATDLQDALAITRRMVDALGADALALHRIVRTAKTLTVAQRDYTIGPGGDFDLVRPLWIDHAGYIWDTSATDPIEIPVRVLTEQEWARVALKTLDVQPVTALYYDKRFDANSRGLITTYPTVTVATAQLVLYTPEAVTGFASLDTLYTFPPACEDAWHYELSARLLRPFSRPPDPDLERARGAAWQRVKTSNLRPFELRVDPALRGETRGSSRSGFYTGWY